MLQIHKHKGRWSLVIIGLALVTLSVGGGVAIVALAHTR